MSVRLLYHIFFFDARRVYIFENYKSLKNVDMRMVLLYKKKEELNRFRTIIRYIYIFGGCYETRRKYVNSFR